MELTIGSRYEVKVIGIKDKLGAVVELSDGSTCFIHISNISDKFVENVSHFVSVGDVLVARCIEGRAKPVELSLAGLKLNSKVGHEYVDSMRDKRSHRATVTGYGGLANPSRGFESTRSSVGRVVVPGQHFGNKLEVLEKMIDSANKDFEDKTRSKVNTVKGNRKKFKRKK